MNKPMILIVEDDAAVRNLISTTLKMQNYKFHVATTGSQALLEAVSNQPDIMLLDLGLPDMDGVEIITKVRSWSNMPIIVISARCEDRDKIEALDAGADDYITKPFSLIVLISKVNAFMRRIGNTIIENIIFCDKLKFDYVENKLTKDKEEILLSKNEGKLLKYLMENSSQTVTKEKLMEALWDIDGNFVDENTVAVNIRRLRQKVEDNPSEPEYIKNIRGVGYTFAKRCIKK